MTGCGRSFRHCRSSKNCFRPFLPVAGTVSEINPALDGSPELVNSDPYGEGWMVKVTVNNPADVEGLLSADAYKELVGE
nr:hypothetical protein [Chitinophaga sedimenti]